jgi:hypothetical protein
VFESASFAFTQIISMPPYRRSNIPLKVFLELPKPPIKTMQIVPPFISPLREKAYTQAIFVRLVIAFFLSWKFTRKLNQ